MNVIAREYFTSENIDWKIIWCEKAGTEQAEAALRNHENQMATMEANDEKIELVLQFGERLCTEGNLASERIRAKMLSISQRFLSI